MTTFSQQTLMRWRCNPLSFIQQCLRDPETGKPFKLLDAERRFLAHAFQLGDDGRLLYPEQVYACPKKSGKTTFAAIHALTTTLLFGGRYPEATICANDLEQARGRVFEMIKRIIECSPLLRAEANITQARIEFPALNATIQAISSDYAGAAGGNPCIAVFDELWAYSTERSHRLWDELVPPPTRKIACRLTVTYAGFAGESTVLESLYQRGLQQPLVANICMPAMAS
jgi:Terminase large subunit, ATPase domain